MGIDQVGSEISLKFARPIRDGERSLFLPSLRLGWAADWGISGGDQKVTYRESGKSKRWDVNGSDDHAALIELGLDYTTYNSTAPQRASMPAAVRWFGVVTAAPAGRCRAA